MVAQTITLAARTSPLSLRQVDEALAVMRPLFPDDTAFTTRPLETTGDKDLQTPLGGAQVPEDFFTREIDQLILSREADLAVHSAKDLPETLPEGLHVAALLPAKDIRDALVRPRQVDQEHPIRTIGTSSPRREEAIRQLYPGAQTKPIRGTIQQRLEKMDAGEYDAVIVAACALHRLDLGDRIDHCLDYAPQPNQGRLALVVHRDNTALRAVLQKLDVRRRAGLVALVGCPADPTLLPERAHTYIEAADVVYHDRLVPDEVLMACRDKAVAVGKAGHQKSISQNEIHRLILEQAEQGQLVVRLHGGDPAVLGHLGETLEFLADWQLRSDVVPAVSAAQVAAAHARAPLTHRHHGRSISFLSGHNPEGYEPTRLAGPEQGNQAIYMGSSKLAALQVKLKQAGWPGPTPVIVGERLGYRDEAITYTTLAELDRHTPSTPAVILIGPTGHPFDGYTLFTGTDAVPFLKYGPILHLPFIKLVPRPLPERVQALTDHLPDCTGIIFPSRFAVRCFAAALLAEQDVRVLAGKKMLAVGPATAEALLKAGIRADAAPRGFGGVKALAEEIDATFSGRYLYLCSDASPTDKRAAAVADQGIELEPLIFYMNRNVPYAALPRLPFSRVLFTSSSTVRSYFENFPEEKHAHRRWIGVGSSTVQTLNDLGCPGEMLHE